MPFIDTTPATFAPKVTESDLQPRLGDILKTQGWTIAANFKKVIFDAGITNPNTSIPKTSKVQIVVAEHFIYANKENKMFGVAIVGDWAPRYGDYVKDPRKDPLPDFAVWTTNEFRKYRLPHTLYTYMLEDLKDLKPNGEDIVLGWQSSGNGSGGDLLRAAVDIEVEASTWKMMEGSPVFTITKAEPGRLQSPIIQAGMRSNLLEKNFEDKYNYAVQYTNWWHDSEISIKGHLTDTNAFFIIQCDNVPAPEGNLVPTIPLHFGLIDALEEGDKPYALFAGSVPIVSSIEGVATYDYDNTTKKLPNIMPLLKAYPKYPANGLNNIIISRSKLGARYQSHYFAWNAPPHLIPPQRTSKNGRDYPRAWNNAESPLYKYAFNPSRYSEKVHTSKVYIVHPEEGIRGSLKDTLALSALSFNASKLRVRKSNCPDEFDVYRYFLVEGVSPFTSKPGTQYRPAGIGLYFNTVDKEGKIITQT